MRRGRNPYEDPEESAYLPGDAHVGIGHLVTYDRTPPRRVRKKPIGFNAVFPDTKPPVKRPARRKKR